jgi:fructokinase
MILCCGEALIDMLPRETTLGETAFSPYSGGAVFNTAIALGRLGAPTGFFSGLSTDLFGKQLIESLSASKVDVARAARADRPTTLAFVTLSNGHASYAFYDENTAGRLLTEDDLPQSLDDLDALFFGGISLPVEPCGAAYEALALRASGDGKLVMIDPNIRPSFITDEPRYRARLNRMMAAADIVKLSDEDLIWLEGEGDIAALAHGLIERGTKLVFITEGATGAHCFSKDASYFEPSRRVEVVDTVGAGDTFNAGILAAFDRAGALSKAGVSAADETLIRSALTLGASAAAITVSRAGANPPWAEELA